MAHNISRNFSFIGKNIKKIRQAKNISQSAFAAMFNLARPSVGAYEEERSEPKIETLLAISSHFNLSVDLLLTRELSAADILSMGLLNKKLDEAHTGHTSSQHMAPLVGISHRTEYIVQSKQKEFLASLPQIPIQSAGIARIFEHEGSEMTIDQQGLNHGDLLYCKTSTVEINKMVVAVTREKVWVRRLSKTSPNGYTLSADNTNYPPVDINKADLLEWWEVAGVYTEHIRKPSEIESRLAHIEQQLSQIKSSN